MKKLFVSMLFLISFSCIWAVWEGNGGVGAASDFPSEGLFVRSDMFPKHTLLEITNLEKNITARAVVIGQSGIPGLLISLSPALGFQLSVGEGKVVRVRVITPSPVREIGDDGFDSGASSHESMDLDSNPALLVASETAAPDVSMEKPIQETSKVEEPVPSKLTYKELPETVPPVEEETADPESEEIQSLPEEPTAETENEKETAIEVETEEEPAEEAPVPVPVEKEPETKPVIVPPVTVYMEPADSRPPIEVAKINSPKKNVENRPEKVKEIAEILKSAPEKEEIQKPVDTVAEPSPPGTAFESEEPPAGIIAPIVEPEKLQNEPDEKVGYIEPIIQPTLEDEEEPEKPAEITEIKKPKETEKISPAPETEPVEQAEQAKPVITEPVQTESESEAENDIYEVTNSEEPEQVIPPTVAVPEKEPLEPKATEKLKKGELYIQIAVYNDKYAAETVSKTYGKQYPVIVEESEKRGKAVYTVFIGPLQREETGAVIERFKKFGFEGSFLKKAE